MCFFIEKICNPLFNSIKAVKNYATGAKNRCLLCDNTYVTKKLKKKEAIW